MKESDKLFGRDRIAVILYMVYAASLLLAAVLIGRIVWLETGFKPDEKIHKALTPAVREKVIYPVRGNIIDRNGNLLAISSPTYQIGIDCTVRKGEYAAKGGLEAKKLEESWRSKAKALSEKLAGEFPEKSAGAYYRMFCEARNRDKQYIALGKPVDMPTLKRLQTYPLFNEGTNKGGLVVDRLEVRTYPYGQLARRTIGFIRAEELKDVTNNAVGLEGKFNDVLKGTVGHEWQRRSDGGYVHNFDSCSVACKDGMDLRTTIDIDYQDIADKALRSEIEENEDVQGACLVLMEVSTGAIRAMANLSREDQGPFSEGTNMAAGRLGEPGSVFKTVTLTSVLVDKKIRSLEQTMPTNHGELKGLKADDHIQKLEREKHISRISIIDGFKISSNYVFGKLAIDNYYNRPDKFMKHLYDWHLAEAFDFDLVGLKTPVIPAPDSTKRMSYSQLGNIGFGYATRLTPIHTITFYNAIAGKGRMMKPYLVESIEEAGIVREKRGPEKLTDICSKEIADTLNRALLAVTEDGTAKCLADAKCRVAGKTGTSFATFNIGGEVRYTDSNNNKLYQATFVGYFPAEAPQYSIICVVYSYPTRKSIQGGGIPARTVKKVVDKLYNIDPCFRGTV